jgi:hypothetical protein
MTDEAMRTMQAMSATEMRMAEIEAARLIDVWVQGYLEFPTAEQFDGLVARMREYQTAWMHIAAKAKAREAAS